MYEEEASALYEASNIFNWKINNNIIELESEKNNFVFNIQEVKNIKKVFI